MKEKVLGFGGFFFKSKNPQALRDWYFEHLGILKVPGSYDEPCWSQSGGSTVFEAFDENSDFFGPPQNRFMLNFKVADLPRMVSQLQTAGIEVEVDPTEYPNGFFAQLFDPEGNPIQLWQPTKEEDL